MELNLSRSERDLLRDYMHSAEPYDEDDPILYTFDVKDRDVYRWRATAAKSLLEQDRREKEAAGRPLEPESTPESERRRRMEEEEG